MVKLTKSKVRLLEMFGTANTKLSEDKIEYLSELIDRYPRKDVSLYVLRQYKLNMLYNKSKDPSVSLDKKEQKFLETMLERQYNQEGQLGIGLVQEYARSFNYFESTFNHYYDLGISNITNKELLFQSPSSLFKEFDQIEVEWKENQNRILHVDFNDIDTEGVIIHTFSNGMSIYDTRVSGCPDVGKASGHCGNGDGRRDQRVMVLISPYAKSGKQWKTHATLVLNYCEFDDDYNVSTCRIGEIKGYANETPNKKYHDLLGEYFLGADFIKGMGEDANAYLPENNMLFSDFSAELQKQILEIKPNFISPIERLVISKGIVTPDLIDVFKDIGANTSETFCSLSQYAERFELNTLMTHSDDGCFDGDHLEVEASECKDLLSKIMSISDNAQIIGAWAVANSFEGNDCDINAENIFNWAYGSGEDDFWLGLQTAVSDGGLAGAEQELYETKLAVIDSHRDKLDIDMSGGIEGDINISLPVSKLIANLYEAIQSECGEFSDSSSSIRLAYDSDIFIHLKDDMENCAEQVYEYMSESKVLQDLDIPRFGFEGFDESVAINSFVDHCMDALDLNLKNGEENLTLGVDNDKKPSIESIDCPLQKNITERVKQKLTF